MMPENDKEIRPTVITFNLKVLVPVIIIVALTILFIQSIQTPYNTIGAEWVEKNSKDDLVLDDIQMKNQKVTISEAKEQTPYRNVQAMKEFQSNKTELIQNDYFKNKPTLYWKNLNHYLTKNKINKSIPGYKIEDNKTDVTIMNAIYQTNNRSNSINHEYSTTNVIPISEENDLNVNYGVKNSSYDSESYTFKEIKIPVDEIKSVTSGQSEQMNIIKFLSTSRINSNVHRPHSRHDFITRYLIGQALNYRPSASIPIKNNQSSKYVTDENYYNLIFQQPIHSEISHKNDEILSLIKLGFIKLKMIGFLQIIFLLGFKLKLFIIAIFIKFLSLMKLMKFFKIVMLPVIILSTLSVYASILNRSNNTQALAGSFTQPSLQNILLPSSFKRMEDSSLSRSSSSLSGSKSSDSDSSLKGISSSSSTILGNAPLNILELLFPSISLESSSHVLPDISRDLNNTILLDFLPGSSIQNKTITPYFTSNIQESKKFNRQQSIKSLVLIFKIFRKILDSEKCVEKIACRVAIVEKAGVIPLWIKIWILNTVSKLIPKEKYELYFKTYNFVNNKIHITKSLTPDHLSEWCLKHYE